MQVAIEPELQRYLESKVQSGEYTSVDAALNSIVSGARELDATRAQIDAGLAQADAGEFANYSAEDVIAERRAARTKAS
jgi:Arc/MetJ-type ribon-helix-helix transcriptional regulator